jgi:serine/threonine protein kinase
MIEFNPRKRISVSEALAHEFLAPFHESMKELSKDLYNSSTDGDLNMEIEKMPLLVSDDIKANVCSSLVTLLLRLSSPPPPFTDEERDPRLLRALMTIRSAVADEVCDNNQPGARSQEPGGDVLNAIRVLAEGGGGGGGEGRQNS